MPYVRPTLTYGRPRLSVKGRVFGSFCASLSVAGRSVDVMSLPTDANHFGLYDDASVSLDADLERIERELEACRSGLAALQSALADARRDSDGLATVTAVFNAMRTGGGKSVTAMQVLPRLLDAPARPFGDD